MDQRWGITLLAVLKVQEDGVKTVAQGCRLIFPPLLIIVPLLCRGNGHHAMFSLCSVSVSGKTLRNPSEKG